MGNVSVEGEPTSVVITEELAIVGVNTSESYVTPSGSLKSLNVADRSIAVSCDLEGQPDSVALAKDASFVVVAIENERDEDLNDGELPQAPAGNVQIFSINEGQLDCGSRKVVDLLNLAAVAPSDPEPEFVDINDLGETVLTLQENNHLVVIDKDGNVINHFSAGAVDLEGIDTKRDGALLFTESQAGRLREPSGPLR